MTPQPSPRVAQTWRIALDQYAALEHLLFTEYAQLRGFDNRARDVPATTNHDAYQIIRYYTDAVARTPISTPGDKRLRAQWRHCAATMRRRANEGFLDAPYTDNAALWACIRSVTKWLFTRDQRPAVWPLTVRVPADTARRSQSALGSLPVLAAVVGGALLLPTVFRLLNR